MFVSWVIALALASSADLAFQYLTTFPTNTPKPNFHVPSAFGMLVLE